MNWYIYELCPIDLNWERLSTVGETVASIREDIEQSRNAEDEFDWGPDLDQFLADWKLAQEAAKEEGWEGDFRHEPAVFWVPSDTDFQYGFVIKQDNNGTTYVISPVPLPHLEPIKTN